MPPLLLLPLLVPPSHCHRLACPIIFSELCFAFAFASPSLSPSVPASSFYCCASDVNSSSSSSSSTSCARLLCHRSALQRALRSLALSFHPQRPTRLSSASSPLLCVPSSRCLSLSLSLSSGVCGKQIGERNYAFPLLFHLILPALALPLFL